MSGHAVDPSVLDEDLAPTETAGYKITEKKSLAEYAELDKEDESLQKWKASLGLGADSSGVAADGPKFSAVTLSLISDSRPTPLELDLTKPEALVGLKKNPVVIKEGADYNVALTFKVNDIVTGLKYIQVVKRAGINVDKLEAMIGSYGPATEPVTKKFIDETAPTGMLARSGTYSVRSRVIDDDKNVWLDLEWAFTLSKSW